MGSGQYLTDIDPGSKKALVKQEVGKGFEIHITKMVP